MYSGKTVFRKFRASGKLSFPSAIFFHVFGEHTIHRRTGLFGDFRTLFLSKFLILGRKQRFPKILLANKKCWMAEIVLFH